MKFDHEDLGKLAHRITVSIDKEDVKKERRRLARRYAPQVKVPGFRPGNAPIELVIKALGDRVEYEVRENLISDSFAKALDEFKLKASTEPKFDLVKDEDDILEYTAEIDVFPEVDVKDYKDIEVTAPAIPEVTDEAVDERIESLRKSLSKYEEKDADSVVEENDMAETMVTLYHLETGEELKEAHSSRIVGGTDDEPVEGIGREILGMRIGEEKTIEGQVDTISAKGLKLDAEGLGKIRATVSIQKIRNRNLPELDSEFVKKHADVETVEEFRALLLKQLQDQREARVKEQLEEMILAKVCENNPFEIGERTIDRLADMAEKEARDRVLQQIPEEKRAELGKDFDLGIPRETSVEEARRNLTRSIILDAVAEKEDIDITESDIEEKLQETADAYGMPVQKIKGLFGAERLEQLGRQLRVGKTMDLLTQNAVVNPAEDAAGEKTAAQKSQKKDTAGKKPAVEKPAAKKAATKKTTTKKTEK